MAKKKKEIVVEDLDNIGDLLGEDGTEIVAEEPPKIVLSFKKFLGYHPITGVEVWE